MPAAGVATLPPSAVRTSFWLPCETRLPSSRPRTQCGTITRSLAGSNPQARSRAVAVAGLLDSAEREVRLRADGRRVHVEDAGVHVAHGDEGIVDVAGVDGRRQSVLHAVADGDGLLERFALHHCRDRPEDLLLR